jgi:hypothetical protein
MGISSRLARGSVSIVPDAVGNDGYLLYSKAPFSCSRFAGSDTGGERAATIYSLIGSAKLNGLDPEHYLRTLLARIAEHPISRIADLLPWNLAESLQAHTSQAA